MLFILPKHRVKETQYKITIGDHCSEDGWAALSSQKCSMEFILAKCESDLQKMTLAIGCQKYSVTPQPGFNALLENRWTKLYAASNSPALGWAL